MKATDWNRELLGLLRDTPVPDERIIPNLSLWTRAFEHRDTCMWYELVKRLVTVPGIICEFGVHYGANLPRLVSLFKLLDPQTRRKLVGFDAMVGLVGVCDADSDVAGQRDFSVPVEYPEYLQKVLAIHQDIIQDMEVLYVGGDARETVPRYLADNPHEVIALANFDFDIYAPTKAVLEAVLPRMPRGAVLNFDEFTEPDWPGEAHAVLDVLGARGLRLQRFPFHPYAVYAVVE